MRKKKIIDQLKIDEGFSQHIYECSAGKKTIGYGWNIEDIGISHELAECVLKKMVDICTDDLYENFSWFEDLPDVMQEVLVNMRFNLGLKGLKTFKKMLEAFRFQDYLEAAKQMKDSKWYKQTGVRAKRLHKIVSEGVFL